MSPISRFQLFITFSLAFVLFGLAIWLVNVQYRARTLFVEHENALTAARHLADVQAELLMKIRRASLPGKIAEGAQAMGLSIAKDQNSASLVIAPNKATTQETHP